MAKKTSAPDLSLSRVSDAIASLEADIRRTKGVSAFDRKRALALLAALDATLTAFCMKDKQGVDFIVAGRAE